MLSSVMWCHWRSSIRIADDAATKTLTCAGIEDGNIGKLVQLIKLDVSLSLFTIMIYLLWKKMHNTIQT